MCLWVGRGWGVVEGSGEGAAGGGIAADANRAPSITLGQSDSFLRPPPTLQTLTLASLPPHAARSGGCSAGPGWSAWPLCRRLRPRPGRARSVLTPGGALRVRRQGRAGQCSRSFAPGLPVPMCLCPATPPPPSAPACSLSACVRRRRRAEHCRTDGRQPGWVCAGAGRTGRCVTRSNCPVSCPNSHHETTSCRQPTGTARNEL